MIYATRSEQSGAASTGRSQLICDERNAKACSITEGKLSSESEYGKKAKIEPRKLSLYPLSVEDALRAAARTGRVTPAKPKRPNRKIKKRPSAT